MAKQLNVNLAFTADTSQAKIQLQDLQKALNSLTTSVSQNSDGLGLTKDIVEATNQVAKLQAMLESSKNVSGGLDLGKFNQSLSKSGLTLKDYANTLNSLGSTGSQAFAQLAKSIVTAEVPLKRTNALLDEFKTSLANTARWQLSSSILHGFMGTLQSAYGYAQDLNESLNNIRIVTGYNSDKMAEFAEQANKAAKALSTTTTDYTNASLIYYQQGLTDKEVQERTDVTIKMANAAGESATKVSDQLTAVWNNFYDGSKSLEYYADVMTKLGAATASSTDEIAEGLEKFAAIADTVGLSYEYATAALATVTSNTRQSADVVGTAFKTIFARMQDLELGDTLDDGTTLGTYSEALAKVGINVLDTNGNLVEMDDLLDSIAAKWNDLSKAQQVSLAQSVAGVRQYTQLVALMDNWDAGDADSMVANLGYVSGAEGSLQEQADIYAESWEAARDRVTAAAEEIYNELLNDDFFITLNNGFASFLGVVSNTIDALGGLPGVLTVASSLMFKMFGSEMATAIDDWGYNIKLRTQEGLEEILNTRKEANNQLREIFANANIDDGIAHSVKADVYMNQANVQDVLVEKQQQLLSLGQELSAEDQKQATLLLDINNQLGERAIKAAEDLDAQTKIAEQLEQQYQIQLQTAQRSGRLGTGDVTYLTHQLKNAKELQVEYGLLSNIFEKVNRSGNFDSTVTSLKALSAEAEKAGTPFTNLDKILDDIANGTITDMESLRNALESSLIDIGSQAELIFMGIRDSAEQAGLDMSRLNPILTQMQASFTATGRLTAEQIQTLKDYGLNVEEVTKTLEKMSGKLPTFGQGIVALGNTLSSVAMSITTIKGMFETWSDEDMSFGDKLLSTFTSLGMVIPMVTNALNAQNLAKLQGLKVDGEAIAKTIARIVGVQSETIATSANTAALWKNIGAQILSNWYYAAAIAIIGVLIGLAYSLAKGYNEDADAAKRAAEGAQNLADAYNECKQEYEEMITAMENYQTARDGLDELTKGTEEYNEALKEANRQVQDLINNYGLIEGQDYVWEGQELVIKDEALNRVKTEKAKEVDVAYGASQMAQVEADRAQERANQTTLKRQIRDDNGVGTGDKIWGSVANGIIAGLGAVLAPVTGGLSLLATGAAFVNQGLMEEKSTEYDAAIDAAVEEARNNPNLFSSTKDNMAETLNLDDQDLIDALWENRDSIQALSDDLEAVDRAEKLAAQEAANEVMAGKGYENTKSGQAALEAGGGVYQQLYDDAYEEYLKNAEDRGWFNTGTDASKQAFNDYAKQTGLDKLSGFKATNYTGDGTVEYEYIDENGDTQKKTATAEEIAATLAAADAANALEGALSQLRGELAELSNSTNLADHALADFLSEGNLESSTKAEFEKLQADVGYSKDENGNITVDDAKVDELLGLTGDANADLAKAKERGYETAEAYRQAFIESLDIEWEVPEGLESLDEVFTVGSSDKIRSTYRELGEDGGQAFVEALKIATSGADWEALDAEQQEAMLNELANIDWSSWEAGDKAIAIAKEYGVAIDEASEAWKNNIDIMRDAANALPDFETLSATLKEIKEISDDIDLGSILSEEDYNTLIAYNSELEKYFAILSDGSAQFIGDKLDFQQAIKEFTQADLEEAIGAYQDRIGELEAQQKAGLEALGGNDVNEYRQSLNVSDNDGNHYSGTDVNTQLDFLKSQGYDADQLAKWKEDLADGSTYVSVLEDIGSAVDSVADSYNGLGNEIKLQQASIQYARNELALTAETVDELDAMLREGRIDFEAYHKAWTALNAESDLKGLDTEALSDYANYLEETMDLSKEAAKVVAKSTMKMNDGVKSLADNFDDWADVLENSSETSEEYFEALNNLRSAISNLLDISGDHLSASFLTNKDNMELMAQAAKGDADAIDALRQAALEDIVLHLELSKDSTLTPEGLWAEVQRLQSMLDAMGDLTVGTEIDDSSFVTACNEMISAAGLTSDQVNALFDGMGYEATFASEPQEVQGYNTLTTIHRFVSKGEAVYGENNEYLGTNTTIRETQTQEQVPNDTVVQAFGLDISPEGESTVPQINSIIKKPTGSSNNYSSTNSGGNSPGKSGGGSSKSKTADKKKEKDVLNRYKEITDALDDVTRATERASKAADRLYGKSRIDAMKQANASLQQEISLLKQKKSEAEDYFQKDYNALNAAATAAGVSFTYDDEHNISNYTAQMQLLLDRYNTLVDQVNTDGDVSDEEQEQLDALDKLITELKEAISQYDDTRELLQDLDEQITDKFYEWQDNNYEILHYELKIEIKLEDLELEYIDYYLKKITDDFYSAAEAAQYMMDKVPKLENKLGSYEDFYDSLNTAYANGEISQADYVEGLQETYSDILKQLQDLNDLDSDMLDYYKDTLELASKELTKYTDKMEHLTSVLEHYKNLIELINGEYDYESIGKLLEAQAKTTKNELDVLTANYKMLLTEKEAIEQSLANAQDDAARELFQKELDAITDAVNDAQEEMLTKTEEWAKAQKAIMENAMAEAAAEMEKAFTDGMGFDALSNSLSRLSSYADEYLTKTNQMYETQKLINTAQQAADKSTNEVAKARLKAYTDEIEQLQNKNQLSNLELEIAKAKYDVVLAEIALEEAQNAKSTVRLQRDSEGNFGYVYTSDQEQISQAEQDLADAQNALYNIGLEGANEYGQKLLELKQQLADELVALEEARAAGQFATDEEYYAARDQLIQQYNNLFLAYSEQYTTALGVDVGIQQQAWVNAYQGMINKTGEWKVETTKYTEKCEEAYKSWRDVVETESEVVDAILNDLESEVNDVTEASDDLKNEVVNQVIPAMNNELISVRNVTAAYAAQRAQIQELISYYEQLTQSILKAIQAQSGLSGSSGSGNSSGIDYSKDYSALMNEAYGNKDWEAYEYYKQMREEKIAAGYSDHGVSTDWIDEYLKEHGYQEGANWVDIFNGGYASGGYTGSWGPEGKLTMLHEKELVLNADDTVNFLKGIDIIRSIADSIDLKALQDQVSILPYNPGSQLQNTNDILEQNVHIEANFPSVQDRNEIQEAFNTLINKASQYANRK